jgi:hypothetical protein
MFGGLCCVGSSLLIGLIHVSRSRGESAYDKKTQHR